MNGIPPVTRGEFEYRDVLIVNVGGELKRHARASEAELKAFLSGKSAKDQVGHWWEAQLVHYGLQRSKQKDTAKVRLQQALSQGKLKTQPPHLADMESQMKKEYAAAVRKAAKSSSAAAEASTSLTTTAKGRKRARDEGAEPSSRKTKISVRVGDVSIDIDHDQSPLSNKKKTSTKSAGAVGSAKTSDASASSSKRTLKSTKVLPEWTPFSSENVFQSSAVKSKAVSRPQSRSASVKKEPGSRPEPRLPASSPSASLPRKGYLFDADAMDTRAEISRDKLGLTGVYTIECPQITEQLPDKQDSLRLFMCVDNESGVTWGGFELAMKSGIIKMDDIDLDRRLTFGWRARDSWDGTLRFGQKCFGNIEFDGCGNVNGVFHSLFNETCEFKGRRRPGPLWSGRSAYKYKQEWDAFPKEAYGR